MLSVVPMVEAVLLSVDGRELRAELHREPACVCSPE